MTIPDRYDAFWIPGPDDFDMDGGLRRGTTSRPGSGSATLLTLAGVPQGCSLKFPTWAGLDSRGLFLSG